MASVIILFVASGILIAVSSFTKKRGLFYFIFSSLAIVSLAVTMVLSANYNNNFFGFSIISMVSLAPLFVILFDFKKNEEVNSADVATAENTKTKKTFAEKFYESDARIFESVALFLSAFFVAFAGLYLGKVTPFGMLACVPAWLVGFSVIYIQNRNANLFDALSTAFKYAGAGMLLGQIFSVFASGFSTASIMTTDAKAVIITVTSSELNSALAFISRDKINNAPLLCFSLLKDSGYIQDILGTPVCKAHFTGWLNKHDQQISLKGRQPTINIYSTINNSTQQKLSALFNSAGFEISFLDSEKDFFWPMFTLNAACSIICSAYDKPIHQILKNKQFRTQLDEIINEFITLAAADDVKMNFSDIMDTIMSIPGGYIFPLHNDFRTGRHRDFHRISSLIKQSARQANVKTPVLNELMARIYEIYLSIT